MSHPTNNSLGEHALYPAFILAALIFVGSENGFCQGQAPVHRPTQKAITQYTHDVWQRENGLPQNSVNTIIQSHNGYIWLGTQEGVVRFDGVKFTVFDRRNTPQLKSNYIWVLYEDSHDVLWIGTSGGGLSCLLDGKCVTYTRNEGLSDNTIWSLYEDSRGTLWVGTNEGLDTLSRVSQNNSAPRFMSVSGLSGAAIGSILEDKDHRLWVGTSQGFHLIQEGKVSAYRLPGGPKANDVKSFLLDGHGNVWIGTNNGLSLWKNGNVVRIPMRDLSGLIIFSVAQDSSGTIWIGTGGQGLWRFADNIWTRFTEEDGLSDNQVKSLCVDREGSIWIGTYGGGLNRLNEGRFATFTTKEGLSDNFVLSVFEDQQGAVWIGTYGRGINKLWRGKISTYSTREGLPSGIITSLCGDRRGNLWIGAFGAGLARLSSNGTISTLRVRDGLSHESIFSLYVDRKDDLWIGTQDALDRYRAGSFTSFTKANSPLSSSVIWISEDHDSNLWLGTNGSGLIRLKNESFEQFNTKNGLSSDIVTAVFEDKEKTLWIGTDGGGLQRLKDGRFFTYSTRDGLFDDVIFGLLEDSRENFWMSSINGIFRVPKRDLELYREGKIPRLFCVNYGTSDGMKSSECSGRRQPSAWKDSRGKFWFATLRGAVEVDPENLKINGKAPSVVIENLVADNRDVPIEGAVELSPGKDKLEFHYTALSFVAPEKVRFKYKLEGYDRFWVDVGSRRTAYYTNIPPGTYHFRVVASNNDGVWNETGASLEFQLQPYFYQTRTFSVIVVAALGLLIVGVFRLRIEQMQRREQELVRLVEERTESLLQEKHRVEQALTETIEARTEAEKQKEIAEEANKVKSQLLGLAAHDLKGPLLSIKGFVHIMKGEAEKDSAVGKMSEIIHTLSNNLLGLINELLNTAAIESGRMALVKHRVDVCQVARAVTESNSEFARSKNQVIELSVEPWGTCIVEADEARLQDAMDNFVTNAIKYTPKNKTISMRVRKHDSNIRFSVQDEGPGLTEDDKQRVFGKFQRLSARPTAGESSTGLGLAIVKEIIGLHGGHVFVESELGKGSTFTIELPAAPERSSS